MISKIFTYVPLGLFMPLTASQEVSRNRHLNASQEVSRNRHLNVGFELSLIILLTNILSFFVFCFFVWFSELTELLSLKAYVIY